MPVHDPRSADDLSWLQGGAVPLDRAGPQDWPYDAALAAAFREAGGIAVIETIAARHPDKVAVDDGARSLTYSVFLRNVFALCERILDRTSPGDVITSVCGHTCESTVIIMAAAMSGRILVPIDSGHPIERQKAIFDQSGAALILTTRSESLDDLYTSSGLPVIPVDLTAPADTARPPHRHDPDAPLFVSFTSGSTGRPKGIVSGGRYGGQALQHFVDMFHINQHDVILGLASLSTGGSRDAFAALGTGAKIRLLDVRGSGISQLVGIIAREQVTILSFVPSALRMILAIDGIEQAFRSLRVLDLHGERILASDIALFRAKLPPTCHISVTMGSVEAGAVFSWFVEDDKIEGETVPVGYLLPGRRVTLLPFEQGSEENVGQLVVRGAMALGAWQNGRIAGGPFIEDPEDAASRIYSMGDLVRLRPDGLFEYAGRVDRRVKIRGLWADLGDIELAMQAIRGIDEAVAVATAADGEADTIAVYVKATGAHRPSQAFIRAEIAALTADHMVPTQIFYVSEIPRLANFKVDLMRLTRLSEEFPHN